MYEVGEGTQGSIGSSHTFDPTHQDGVDALTAHGEVFFSGSRDDHIKKWDLASKRLLQVLYTRVIYASGSNRMTRGPPQTVSARSLPAPRAAG